MDTLDTLNRSTTINTDLFSSEVTDEGIIFYKREPHFDNMRFPVAFLSKENYLEAFRRYIGFLIDPFGYK